MKKQFWSDEDDKSAKFSASVDRIETNKPLDNGDEAVKLIFSWNNYIGDEYISFSMSVEEAEKLFNRLESALGKKECSDALSSRRKLL